MDSATRRKKILEILKLTPGTVSGAEFAARLGVSRQVVVQDIALLRAKGENIMATPQGYLLNEKVSTSVIGIFACKHSAQELQQELYLIVDNGGKVLDVSVEHPLYGEICAQLMLASRMDVDIFIKDYQSFEAKPLSALTEGIHLHRVEAKNEQALLLIEKALRKAGFLCD